jgi:hypothetical protein
MTEEFKPFKCPYCGLEVQKGDLHGEMMTRGKLRGTPTVIVTCRIVREYTVEVEVKE